MDPDQLRAACLRRTGAIEDFPFGPEHSVFKVAGKMFALSALDRAPLEVSLKCEPDLAAQLRDSHPAVRPGYHLNKRHWNTITLDGSLPDKLVHDMIEDSHDLVVSALPKRVHQQLGWSHGAGQRSLKRAVGEGPGDWCGDESPAAGTGTARPVVDGRGPHPLRGPP